MIAEFQRTMRGHRVATCLRVGMSQQTGIV